MLQYLIRMSAGTVLTKAIELITKATEEDKNKNYKEALQLYERGLEYFIYSLKFESQEEKAKEIIRARCAQYLDRAEMLKKALKENDLNEHEKSKKQQTGETHDAKMQFKKNPTECEKTNAVSVEGSDNSKMEKLLIELECPICTDYLTVPIRQCATGHSVCGKCFEKLDRCALCRKEFTNSRNITLESLAMKMEYPCINKDAGCSELLSYDDREKHEHICSFGIFQTRCLMRGCTFIGDIASLKSHWLAKKMSSKMFLEVSSTRTKLKENSFYVNLAESFGQLFWFKSKTLNNTLYFAMQLIGKPEVAQQYYFEVEINLFGSSEKKIILTDSCKSIELTDNELFQEDICCNIGFKSIAHALVDGFLKYTLRMSKKQP
ncbi:hypothetical protein HHI36_002972 [Cryptolaemus montrouzieri]|uniref:E3 ubiquitin-protein ligase n=1 Tax=Cryptolaemus montrouzieri TaxID=559131 RepID=A0ABD2PD00_9CUCU